MDLASCTTDLSFLPYTIVQLRGNQGGFIQDKLEIFCWGKRIKIKFFPLNGRASGFHGVGFSLAKEIKGEDDDDVEVRAKNKTLVRVSSPT